MNAEEAVLLVELYHSSVLGYDTAYALYAVAVSASITLCGIEIGVTFEYRFCNSVLAENVLIVTSYRKLKSYAWVNGASCSLNCIIEDIAEKGCGVKVIYAVYLTKLACDYK